MKKDIFRNIAIVTIIFMVVLSVMLVTNYFQVRGVTPLQMEVTETLRTLNEGNEENPELLLLEDAWWNVWDSRYPGYHCLH